MKPKSSRKNSAADWQRLANLPDHDIDLAENPELGDDFFENASLRMPEPKKSISLRIDPDLLVWFKKQGPGYQTRINAVLRMYMQAKVKSTGSPQGKRNARRV